MIYNVTGMPISKWVASTTFVGQWKAAYKYHFKGDTRASWNYVVEPFTPKNWLNTDGSVNVSMQKAELFGVTKCRGLLFDPNLARSTRGETPTEYK